MSPNAEQRAILARTDGDVVVTAGAGTGKTRTLVARYLSLLADGVGLRTIVAVTFTRKAANEMRNRVREAIRTYTLGTGAGAEDRARWQGHYAALDTARIGTIHSLCSEILRAQPLEAGIDPRFEVLDEGRMGVLFGEAAEEALAAAAERPEMTPLFATLGERDLGKVLDALLRRPLEAAEAFSAVRDDVRARWEARLTGWQTRRLHALLRREDWRALAERLHCGRPLVEDDRMVAQWRAVCVAVDEPPEELAACLDALA
ncbi:MAG: UvrD-helicase domain-containing protein, partial [Chloroflexi bacterium]|nr:UvrD-helicase domain-containing protein [Chloroflexota bacterium]